jgi:nucleotide-binding universal stress UspA family protein
MGTDHEHTIVVGFDGSKGATAALGWAVHEAEMRGEKLCIIQAWTAGEFGTDAEIEAYTQSKLDTSVREALNGTTSVEYETLAVRGSAAKVLVEHSADADMLVVGSRGRGGFAGLLLGSVSQQVSAHAGVPAVVIVHSPS